MDEVKLPTTKTVKVDAIKPYWRNPRKISAEAVAAVQDSIERYGYQQPIVVDKDMVVIVGHTRLQALNAMGVDEVPVYVFEGSEEKAKEFRLIDNRTQEISSWDHSALILELREFEEDLLNDYFPDIDLEVQAVNDVLIKDEDVEKSTKEVLTVKEAKDFMTTQVHCPSCYNEFSVRTDSLPGVTREDLIALNEANGGGE